MQFTTGGANDGGRYMVHCHNLIHEDNDMMIQFAVGDINANDPIISDASLSRLDRQRNGRTDVPEGTSRCTNRQS